MATLDHLILKVNDLDASVAFYTGVLGFASMGRDGPFAIVRAGADFQIQMAPWGTRGMEHYAFAVSKAEFEEIFRRIKAANIAYGPTFDLSRRTAGNGSADVVARAVRCNSVALRQSSVPRPNHEDR